MLPAELQAAPGVVALDGHGQPQVWRASANGMICLADSPGDSTFDARCYQAEFVPVICARDDYAAATSLLSGRLR